MQCTSISWSSSVASSPFGGQYSLAAHDLLHLRPAKEGADIRTWLIMLSTHTMSLHVALNCQLLKEIHGRIIVWESNSITCDSMLSSISPCASTKTAISRNICTSQNSINLSSEIDKYTDFLQTTNVNHNC